MKNPIPISLLLPAALEELKKNCSERDGELDEYIDAKIGAFSLEILNQIPTRFRKYAAEPVPADDLARLKSGDILTILGPVGVGKTALGYRISYSYLLNLFAERRLGKQKTDFMMTTGEEFIFEMRRSYGLDRAEETRKNYRRRSLLFFDDLFSTMITDSTHEEILHLINYRSAWLAPMIITTNKSLNELKEIDARIPSRLKGGHVVYLDGQDKRLKPPQG